MFSLDAITRCWNDIGVTGPQNQFRIDDATSPSGKRRTQSWYNVHNKGSQFVFADGHAKFFRVQSTFAANMWKWDCFQLPSDEAVFPDGGFGTKCAPATNGAMCASLASQLLPTPHL